MNRHGMHERLGLLAAATVAAGLLTTTAAAVGQDGPTSRPADRGPTTQSDSERGLLAGPTVKDAAARPESGRDRAASATDLPRIPVRVWFQALRSIDLTPEQTRAFTAKVRSFQQSTRAFQRQKGPRLRALAERMRNARRGGDSKPLTADEQMELESLRAEAPRPTTVQTEIWDQLTPAQQDAMRAALDRAAEEMQRGDRRGERRGRDRGTERGPAEMDRRGEAADERLDKASRRRAAFLRSRQSTSDRD